MERDNEQFLTVEYTDAEHRMIVAEMDAGYLRRELARTQKDLIDAQQWVPEAWMDNPQLSSQGRVYRYGYQIQEDTVRLAHSPTHIIEMATHHFKRALTEHLIKRKYR